MDSLFYTCEGNIEQTLNIELDPAIENLEKVTQGRVGAILVGQRSSQIDWANFTGKPHYFCRQRELIRLFFADSRGGGGEGGGGEREGKEG